MPGKLLARSNYVCIVAWGRERSTRNIRESATPMSPPEEFLKHAAECELMAKFSRRREDKETWRRMAERWLRCADLFTKQSLAARDMASAKRRSAATLRWAHH